MAITVRMSDKEQEMLRKKCIELNKLLINRNLMPIKESELVHIILEQCIDETELTTSGQIKVINKYKCQIWHKSPPLEDVDSPFRKQTQRDKSLLASASSLLVSNMNETAIQLNNMSAEIESMLFRMILFKGITAIVLIAILVYVIYKLIKYYENKDIEIKFSYKEKNKIDERKEPKL